MVWLVWIGVWLVYYDWGHERGHWGHEWGHWGLMQVTGKLNYAPVYGLLRLSKPAQASYRQVKPCPIYGPSRPSDPVRASYRQVKSRPNWNMFHVSRFIHRARRRLLRSLRRLRIVHNKNSGCNLLHTIQNLINLFHY